ncbi:MAG TPA: hypothetical protein VFT60_11525, partial [Bryobacteraceae bacterium]|nr:hypothetical protein [Bryobacteraceae bacterium]
MKRSFALALVVVAIALGGSPEDEWPAYGRDPGGQRFSPLTAINRKNVSSLKRAWIYRTGDGYQP